MKRFSRGNSYIFPQNELKPIFLRKNFLYKLLYFLEDLVDSLISHLHAMMSLIMEMAMIFDGRKTS